LNLARPSLGTVRLLATAVVSIALAACGERVEAGLANAPSMERQTRPRLGHDVISNGDDSCPRTVGGLDPLTNRLPPCNEGFDDAGLRSDAQTSN
jgi:hypothetical protein